MLQPSKQKQFLEQQVKSLYKGWIQTQQELKEITDPSIKRMWVEELMTLYQQAQQLITEPLLDGSLYQSHLKVITSRTPEQWAILARSTNKPLM
jgi:hypothetical protein